MARNPYLKDDKFTKYGTRITIILMGILLLLVPVSIIVALLTM